MVADRRMAKAERPPATTVRGLGRQGGAGDSAVSPFAPNGPVQPASAMRDPAIVGHADEVVILSCAPRGAGAAGRLSPGAVSGAAGKSLPGAKY